VARVSTEASRASADRPTRRTGVVVARYGLARAGLVAVVTALLVVAGVPWQVGLLVALVASVPLSMLLLKPLRRDLDDALSVWGEQRRERRARLRAQLRGDEPAGDTAPAHDTAPAGDTAPAHDTAPAGDAAAGSGDVGQREADGGGDRPDQHDQAGLTQHGDQPPAAHPAEDRPDR
jgi:hypothetical protein